VIGIYLQDESGAFVANFDAPPRDGRLLTTSLPPGYRLEDTRAITLPEQPGVYRVYVGVYRQDTGERLPLNNGADTLGLLGTIKVE
jgi:hypothetical protein